MKTSLKIFHADLSFPFSIEIIVRIPLKWLVREVLISDWSVPFRCMSLFVCANCSSSTHWTTFDFLTTTNQSAKIMVANQRLEKNCPKWSSSGSVIPGSLVNFGSSISLKNLFSIQNFNFWKFWKNFGGSRGEIKFWPMFEIRLTAGLHRTQRSWFTRSKKIGCPTVTVMSES